MGSTVRFGEPKCQGAVFPAEGSNSSRACDVSRESSRKPFSGTLDRICACVPQSDCAVLDSLSATCCQSAASETLLLLAAACCCTWIPRPATFDRSDCFQRPSYHTTTGPYPSRLLLPSPPTTTTTTTTTNSPYRLRHINAPDPTGPHPRFDPISPCTFAVTSRRACHHNTCSPTATSPRRNITAQSPPAALSRRMRQPLPRLAIHQSPQRR